MPTEKILVTGACGQLGTEIVTELRARYGEASVIATDIIKTTNEALLRGPFEILDTTNKQAVGNLLNEHKINQIYHLAAILSARGEQQPNLAWDVNINGFMAVLDAAVAYGQIVKFYFPSSIAVFGTNTPKDNTPQHTVTDANTVYGISKFVGERLCEYYHAHYGLDLRSLRYPGIISYKTLPGGGTTDYAVHIYHEAIKHGHYDSFLNAGSYLPMMYMPDALKATFDLMEADSSKISIRSSYNLGAMSFCPEDIAASIKKEIPDFTLGYAIDPVRQKIANSWPKSIDDSQARQDWGWAPAYDLDAMTRDMLSNIKELYAVNA